VQLFTSFLGFIVVFRCASLACMRCVVLNHR
jgi:hypothetical protein